MQKFKVWIKQFEGANSPFGDLAGDMARDTNFPTSNSYKVLHEYLDGTAVLETFERAWEHYKGKSDTKNAHYQLAVRLEFVNLLLNSIRCSPDANELLRGKESACLEEIEKNLLVIQSNMDDLIFREKYEWANTQVYYGFSSMLVSHRDNVVKELDAIAMERAAKATS